MSSSDSGESTADAFGGIHFTFGGPVQVGAPGYRPSPELMSLAATFMPFLPTRMRENDEARDQQAHVNTESDGGNDGKGQKKQKSGGSGTEDNEMKVQDGVGGASSSTGMQPSSTQESRQEKKTKKSKKGKKGKKNYWSPESSRT